MPRSLKEIKQFITGTIHNASERDISDDTAAFSLNVDPMAENGSLDAIKNDRIMLSTDNTISRLLYPVSWGSSTQYQESGNYNTSSVIVPDISIFGDDLSDIHFIGAKGRKEKLKVYGTSPWWERVKINATLNVTYTPATAITSTQNTIPFLTNTNAIGGNAAAGNTTIAGFTDGAATIQVDTDDPATLADKTIIITSPDGKILTYIIKNSAGTTGTVDGSSQVQIFCPSTSAYDTDDEIAAEIKLGIEHANGHAGRIGISQKATATITITDVTEINNGDKVNLIATDSTSHDFTAGDVAGGGTWIAETDNNTTATNLATQINANTKFSASADSAVVTVTQATSGAAGNTTVTLTDSFTAGMSKTDFDAGVLTLAYIHEPLDSYLSTGDYLVLTTSMNASTNEYIIINSIDATGTLNVTRNVLGSSVGTYAITTEYQVWSSRLTIDSIQSGTSRGILVLSGWSNYSGNDIGGNGNWINKASNSTKKQQLGAVTTDITFGDSAGTAKTIRFESLSSIYFNEGETLNIYYPDSQPNTGKSFKILKKEIDSSDVLLTVDTAPAYDDEDTHTIYLEANLLKNHTFHHASDEVNPTLSVGSGNTYKVNHWESKNFFWTTVETNQVSNRYTTMGSGTLVQRINTGGYWEDATADHGTDNAANYYPFDVNDAYIRIEATYKDTGLNLTADATVTDNFLAVGDKSIISVNDILKVDSEYMRVTSMTANILQVERGFLESTPTIHDSTPENVYKSINPLIRQDVSKDRLKAGQPYILTFHAKDLFNSTYGYGAVSVRINGGYFNEGGIWKKASLDNGMGYSISTSHIMQEDRWIDFNDLGKANGDVAYNADGTESITGLDTTWRRFELSLYLPKGFDLSTDMVIEFTSRGRDTTQIGIDLVDLSELTYIVPVATDSKVDSIGAIDNAGKKDLVLYDNKLDKLRVVKDFDQDSNTPYISEGQIEKSPYAASEVSSSTGKASFVSRNRETHIGFGPKNEDSAPQWLGYLNNKAFGVDSSKTLYQDEDTVHTYDNTGLVAMSKVVLAGEHENLAAAYLDPNLTIQHDNNSVEQGDNIVIREWLDTDNSWDGNGVWVVTSKSTDEFVCQRITSLDAKPIITLSNNLISYRPYYYYGIRDGDNHLYRILPDNLWTAPATESTTYKRGKTEKSFGLTFIPTSIATCYNKDTTNGVGGGRIYILTNTGEIKVVSVNNPYNKWNKLNLTIISTIFPYYKSYKWSNDSTTGDINGDTAVFHSLAAESTPDIVPTGIISDIIETKGSTSTFDYDSDNNTDNTPAMFDTRLWIQFRPNSGETFTAGDRFLFCGLTNSTNTNTTSNITFGDRTPPTNVTFPKRTRWDTGGNMFHGGPGLWTNASNMMSGADIGDFPSDKVHHHALFKGSRIGGQHHDGRTKEKFNLFAVRTGKDDFGWYGTVNKNTASPFINFGNNVGWDADGGTLTSIRVIKYGLFAMGDNNCDGVIDGTGLVVCSNQTLTQYDAGSGWVGNQKLGPYGYEHETVCSHAVGLIGGADTPWVRDWGCMEAMEPTGSSGDYHYTGVYGRAPENMSCEKFVFICSDVHFGDKHFENVTDGYIPTETPYSASVTLDGAAVTEITVGSTAGFKPGMNIYMANKDAATIMKIVSSTKFIINEPFSYASSSHDIYPFINGGTNWINGTNADGTDKIGSIISHGGVREQHYHFAFDDEENLNSDIFTNAEDGGGHYSKTWWTVPDTTSLDKNQVSNHQAPGLLHRVDRLNYRAGYMIRPFDLDDNTFEDMIIGNGVYIDAPVRPDTIYHLENSTGATHNNQGDDEVNNQFASKIFITAPVEDTYDDIGKSKMYICDPTFEYPDILHQIEKTMNPGSQTTNEWNGTETSYEPHLYGKIDNYYTADDTSTNTHRSANIFPVIRIAKSDCIDEKSNFDYMGTNSPRDNGFVGQMLTIVDADTGVMQTRQIVSSDTTGSGQTLYLGVHFPFGHLPVVDDLFYVWSHKYACTAPIRLFREKELGFSLANDGDNTVAFKADPILSAPIYKTTGTIGTIDGDASTITVTTDNIHNLSTNDVIVITDTLTYEDIGPVEITITGPKQFTFADTAHELGPESVGTWTLQEIDNSDSSVVNPIKFDIDTPLVKATFGGLDMRKSRGATISSIAEGGGDAGDITVTASANHFFDVGDTVTIDSGVDTQDGIYPITADNGSTTFDVTNTIVTTSTGPVTTNQWESLLMATTGTGNTAEIRAGFNAWDTGQSQGNLVRNDNSTASSGDKYLNVIDSSVTITSPSLGDETNDYFLKNNEYEYKIALRYDGYQESPLSSSTWSFKDTSKTRSRLAIDISIMDYSKRLTQVCLYRRDNKDSFFRLVKQIETSGGWNFDGTSYNYSVDDSGAVRGSYEARTGRSEVLDTIKLKYGISTEIDGYLFAANCSHENIENASNQIFRSKPGMFSVFDYAFDFMQLKSRPTALANFAGRLYAFDTSNIYRINQHNLAVEDIYEGIGCLSKDSVIVTEYGMFFADKNGAYLHDGQSPKKISGPIEQGGGTDNEWSGTDNIRDISWKSIVGSSLSVIPYVSFDANISSVLFFVTYNDYDSTTTLSKAKQYVWSFNLIKNRWDLWEVSENASIGTPFLGDKGAVFIPVDNVVYEYRGGSSKRDYTWLSKKLTMEEDSILKVYNKVKLNGITDNLLQGGTYKESSDRLLVKTSAGDVSTSDITFSTTSGKHSEYKLKSSNKKGRWIQFKLEDMTSPVDSLGIIYRRKSTK